VLGEDRRQPVAEKVPPTK
jgi:hypothetical protein